MTNAKLLMEENHQSLIVDDVITVQSWEKVICEAMAKRIKGGRVLEGGIGLGFSSLTITKNKNLKKHLIIEKYKNVIELVKLDQKLSAQSEIIYADFFDYIFKIDHNSFDYITVDCGFISILDPNIVKQIYNILKLNGEYLPFIGKNTENCHIVEQVFDQTIYEDIFIDANDIDQKSPYNMGGGKFKIARFIKTFDKAYAAKAVAHIQMQPNKEYQYEINIIIDKHENKKIERKEFVIRRHFTARGQKDSYEKVKKYKKLIEDFLSIFPNITQAVILTELHDGYDEINKFNQVYPLLYLDAYIEDHDYCFEYNDQSIEKIVDSALAAHPYHVIFSLFKLVKEENDLPVKNEYFKLLIAVVKEKLNEEIMTADPGLLQNLNKISHLLIKKFLLI